MGTSRGPIREAIKVLAGLGIVTAVANRGVFVRQLSLREMVEIYELRALVFGYAADRACEHLHRRAQEADGGPARRAWTPPARREDGTLYYELNLQFHALILVLSNNRRAHQAYDDYVKELHLVRRKYFNAPGNMRRSNVEHRAIFEAIVAVEPLARRARPPSAMCWPAGRGCWRISRSRWRWKRR